MPPQVLIPIMANTTCSITPPGNGMNYVSTPFREPETIRVELIPGSGEVIKFTKNDTGTIESLNYAGVEYRKVK